MVCDFLRSTGLGCWIGFHLKRGLTCDVSLFKINRVGLLDRISSEKGFNI